MFKKVLSLVIVAALLFSLAISFTSCKGDDDEIKGMSASPLDIPALTADFQVPENFKIGFICLHDESSTYDLNFINAVLRYQEALGLTNEQVIIKRNIEETEKCYEAAVDLVSQGCDIIFANSFGHEPYIAQAAETYPNVQFCHATGVTAADKGLANFHNAFASIYEGRFLAGVAAGLKLVELYGDAEGKVSEYEVKVSDIEAAKNEIEEKFNQITAEFEEMKPKYEDYVKAEQARIEAEIDAQKDAEFAKYEAVLADDANFAALKENKSEMTIKEIESECAIIYARKNLATNFSKADSGVMTAGLVDDNEKDGFVITKYGCIKVGR